MSFGQLIHTSRMSVQKQAKASASLPSYSGLDPCAGQTPVTFSFIFEVPFGDVRDDVNKPSSNKIGKFSSSFISRFSTMPSQVLEIGDSISSARSSAIKPSFIWPADVSCILRQLYCTRQWGIRYLIS